MQSSTPALQWLLPSLLLVAACTTGTDSLEPEERAALGRTPALHLAIRVPADFVVHTPENRRVELQGVVGIVMAHKASESAGADLRQRYGLPDPALAAGESFAASLRRSLGAPEISSRAEEIDADAEPAAVAARFPDGVVLDFRTESWDLSYEGSGSNELYVVHYRALARLVEAPSGRVLWQLHCRIDPSAARHGNELEKLLDDGGAGLKERLTAAGRACAVELERRLCLPEAISGQIARRDRSHCR